MSVHAVDANHRPYHTCDTCGHTGWWASGWRWYGSYKDMDDGVIVKFCSCECQPDEAGAWAMLKRKKAAA